MCRSCLDPVPAYGGRGLCTTSQMGQLGHLINSLGEAEPWDEDFDSWGGVQLPAATAASPHCSLRLTLICALPGTLTVWDPPLNSISPPQLHHCGKNQDEAQSRNRELSSWNRAGTSPAALLGSRPHYLSHSGFSFLAC